MPNAALARRSSTVLHLAGAQTIVLVARRRVTAVTSLPSISRRTLCVALLPFLPFRLFFSLSPLSVLSVRLHVLVRHRPWLWPLRLHTAVTAVTTVVD